MCFWRCKIALPLWALFERIMRCKIEPSVEEISTQCALTVYSTRLAPFALSKYLVSTYQFDVFLCIC
jgi:hypothetical protein